MGWVGFAWAKAAGGDGKHGKGQATMAVTRSFDSSTWYGPGYRASLSSATLVAIY